MDVGIIIQVGTMLVTAGAAWGGTRAALNGTRERVKEIAIDFKRHCEIDEHFHRDTVDRLARIETKVERSKDESERGNW